MTDSRETNVNVINMQIGISIPIKEAAMFTATYGCNTIEPTDGVEVINVVLNTMWRTFKIALF